MAGATGSQDQSMEEILQSIKRIIAEEGDEETGADTNALHSNVSVKGSDVLELTDFVEEAMEEAAEAEINADEYMQLDEVLGVKASQEEADAMDFLSEDTDVTHIMTIQDQEKPFSDSEEEHTPSKDVLNDIDTLLSDEVARTTAGAFKELAAVKHKPHAPSSPSADTLHYRSGTTVEDLTLELLRPMMKQWLDANLPDIVERLVQQEIRRLNESSY